MTQQPQAVKITHASDNHATIPHEPPVKKVAEENPTEAHHDSKKIVQPPLKLQPEASKPKIEKKEEKPKEPQQKAVPHQQKEIPKEQKIEEKKGEDKKGEEKTELKEAHVQSKQNFKESAQPKEPKQVKEEKSAKEQPQQQKDGGHKEQGKPKEHQGKTEEIKPKETTQQSQKKELLNHPKEQDSAHQQPTNQDKITAAADLLQEVMLSQEVTKLIDQQSKDIAEKEAQELIDHHQRKPVQDPVKETIKVAAKEPLLKKPEAKKQKPSQPVQQPIKQPIKELPKSYWEISADCLSKASQQNATEIQLKSISLVCGHKISQKDLRKFFSDSSEHTNSSIQKWSKGEFQAETQVIVGKMKSGQIDLQRRLHTIIDKIDPTDSTERFQGIVQFGDGKGKTSGSLTVKILKPQPELHHQFSWKIEIKSKRPSQLQGVIERELSKVTNSELLHGCEIQFVLNEKSLSITIFCLAMEAFYADLIQLIQDKFKGEPVDFLFELGLTIRSQLRDLTQKFVTWISEGLLGKVSITANSTALKYCLSGALEEIFPSVKLIRNGNIHLKFHQIEQVDRFYQTLGIKHLVDSSPPIKTVLQQLLTAYLSQTSHHLSFLQTILEGVLSDTSNLGRISMNIHMNISRLNINLTFSSEGINLVKKTLEEIRQGNPVHI